MQRQRRVDRHPSAHWGLFALVLLLLAFGLTLAGYADHQVGRAATAKRGSEAAQAALPAGSGSILDLRGRRIRTVAPASRTIALTFDDGPDPTWTPKILDVLHQQHVPGTFFVVGARAGKHPDLVKRIHREGHELGSHTFSHADMTRLSGWERNIQLSLTQTELAGTAGIHTSLFRPPYSSTPDAFTKRDLDAMRPVADRGYLVVLSDTDSRDWERPGVDAVLRAATPRGEAGAVVLFHDGGGNRRQTVAALRRLIPALRARGYRFATVSDVVRGGTPRHSRSAEVEASLGERVPARALVALQRASGIAAHVIRVLLIPLGILTLVRAILVVWFARRHVREHRRRAPITTYEPSVSIVVPAYNEEAGIAAAVRSLAEGDHPGIEVIVVDDGSTDDTPFLVAALDLPNVRLISQANTGKAGALNTGITAATHELIVTVDGDTVFQPDTVGHLVRPFVDPEVQAVSGNTKVANRSGLLGRWQHIEYVMGFNLDRRMYERLNCMPTVPGAIGAFRADKLRAIGGVAHDTLAEDTDLTMAINRHGGRVVFEERAIAWTEAPSSLNALWRQRYRWSYGTMQAMWKHRRAVFDREHRATGRRALPYMLLFQVILPLLAPLIDLWTIYGLAFLDPWSVLSVWLAFNLVQAGVAAYAFHLDHERMRVLWALPLQQFVYRQLMYLVVIQSALTALLGVRLRWQHSERTGAINPRGRTLGDPDDVSITA